MSNYWYKPHVTEQDIINVNPDKFAALDGNAYVGEVRRYMDAVRASLEYPFYWESLKIRLPLLEIFNAKIGSSGDNVKNRVRFQILEALFGIYGKLPGFSLQELVDKVEEIATLPPTKDLYPDAEWFYKLESAIGELDSAALFRSFKVRFREQVSNFDIQVQKQYDDAAVGDDNGLDLDDQLSKQLCLLIPDVENAKEAEFITSQENGILIAVGDFSPDLFDAVIESGDDIAAVRRVIHEQMKQST
jgi:hypothetical protein